MSEYQEKNAKVSETQRAFITPLVGGVAAGAVAYGLPAALDKVRSVRVRRNRDKYITSMKDVHPDLKGVPKKDLHVAYNSMAIHSPHVLRDPLLGGQELLRMSKYRQANIATLNEMNKLRDNSMMDQAFLNATNLVAGGVGEGFKGYQAQRLMDQDQAYRAKMDKQRQQMDKDKLTLERDKFTAQKGQFGASFEQRENQFEAGFGQKEHHAAQSFKQRENAEANRDAYARDRDAIADAQWTASHGLKDAKNTREEINFGNAYTTVVPAVDSQGDEMYDGHGNALFHSHSPGHRSAAIAVEQHQPHTFTPSQPHVHSANAPARKNKKWGPKKAYTKTKVAAPEYLTDIVFRLRDRNP
jgi:hypothetical protein